MLPHGINLTGNNYHNTDSAFIDLTRSSGGWSGKGGVGEDGWPLGATTQQMGCAIPLSPGTADYTLIVTKGEMAKARVLNGDVPMTKVSDTVFTFRSDEPRVTIGIYPKGTGPVQVAVMRSDYVDRWRKGERFTPEFLTYLDSAYSIRFMDWLGTNNGLPARIPQMGDATWMGRVPVEVNIELCNILKARMWHNVHPDLPMDQAIAEMRLIDSRLNPDLRVNNEWGNEVWNLNFRIGKLAAKWPGGSAFGYGVRVGQMAIAMDVAGLSDRMGVAICEQFVSPHRIGGVLQGYDSVKAPRSRISTIAGAPYIMPRETRTTLQAWAVANDQQSLFASMEKSLATHPSKHAQWAAWARQLNVDYDCYEINTSLDPKSPEQQKLFEPVAHSERAARLVEKGLGYFFAAGGSCAHFLSSAGKGGDSGYWGMSPYYVDPVGYPVRRMWVAHNARAWKRVFSSAPANVRQSMEQAAREV